MKTKVILSIVSLFLIISSSCYESKQKPDDFDEFWQSSLKELDNNLVYDIVKDTIIKEKKVSLIAIKSYKEVTIYSWVSIPEKPGKFPVFISFFGFGRGKASGKELPSKWFLSQKNRINMVVDIRGQGLSKDQIKFKGYLTNGLENRNNYIYRGAYLDAVKAVDYAKTLLNGDGNIIAMGGSQGGALAVAATALNPNVTMCIASFPFLTDMHNYEKDKWPMKIWIHDTKIKRRKLEDLHETLSYFDVLNFAEKVDVPFLLRTQETDIVTPKEGAIKLFNAVKSNNKNLYIAPCSGHGCSSKSSFANKIEQIFIEENLKK